jgi:hypothetical protein
MEKTMLTASKWALTILPAGLALGALLGAAVNPVMKDAPTPWWQLSGRDEVAVSHEQFAEAWPQDLSPFGGYRPDLDYDAEAWALPIPAYELAPLADEPLAPPPLPDEMPTVSYGVTEADSMADSAEAAEEDAFAAQASDPEPAPEAEARKSELALAGIY